MGSIWSFYQRTNDNSQRCGSALHHWARSFQWGVCASGATLGSDQLCTVQPIDCSQLELHPPLLQLCSRRSVLVGWATLSCRTLLPTSRPPPPRSPSTCCPPASCQPQLGQWRFLVRTHWLIESSDQWSRPLDLSLLSSLLRITWHWPWLQNLDFIDKMSPFYVNLILWYYTLILNWKGKNKSPCYFFLLLCPSSSSVQKTSTSTSVFDLVLFFFPLIVATLSLLL